MKKHCIFDLGEPSFVNDEGVKWWLVADDSEMPRVKGYLVEVPENIRDYVIVDHDKEAVVYTTKKFESLAVHMDIMRLAREGS